MDRVRLYPHFRVFDVQGASMRMRVVGIAMVFISALGSSAQSVANGWNFVFQDVCGATGCFDLGGHFAGSDGNRDGIIAFSELQALNVDTSYWPSVRLPPSGPLQFVTDTFDFSYTIGGKLSFFVLASAPSWTTLIDAGILYRGVGSRATHVGDYYFTQPAVVSLSTSPIPEPGRRIEWILGACALFGIVQYHRAGGSRGRALARDLP